jgi:g-D-glutamyl-meso-diaminopimelate peptidase
VAEAYFDYGRMINELDGFLNKYSFLSVIEVGKSILGNSIPAVIFGEGKSIVAYVGGEVGCDPFSPFILMRFLRDACALYEGGGSAFGFSAENIFKNYTLVIIPLLNPDGLNYFANGIELENPLFERVMKLNGGGDFSHWRGNARGVDLKYNYGLEYSESQPEAEVGRLCNFLRYGFTPDMLIDFSYSQGENEKEVIRFCGGEEENKMAVALSQMSGIAREYSESVIENRTLFEWARGELYASAFSVELERIDCLSKKHFEDTGFLCYLNLRKLLYCAPFLSKLRQNRIEKG